MENETMQQNESSKETATVNLNDVKEAKAEAELKDNANSESEKVKAETKETESSENSKDAKEEKKEEKKSEVDYKQKYYYLAAEMDNLRKRSQREKENLAKFANEDLLKSMLDILDNFDRTVDALQSDEDEKVKNIVTGINMVRTQFLDTVAKFGLETVKTENEEFDPNFHEALSQQVVEGKKESEIVQVFQKGYILNGRLLRAAKVVVAK